MIDNLNHNIINYLNLSKQNLETSINSIKLLNPQNIIQNKQNILKEYTLNLNNIIDKKLTISNHNIEYLINSLNLVNPLNILSKGYSLVKSNDKIIKDAAKLKIDDEINIKFSKGNIKAKVKEINKDEK